MFVIKLYSNHVLLIHNSFFYLRCTCVYIYADWILPQNTLEYNSWQFIMDYDHITVNSRMTVFHETDWISVACITSTASLDQISWKNLSTWSYRSQRMRWMKSSSTSKFSLTSERIWQLLAISVKSNDREYKYICQIEKEVNKVMDTMYICVHVHHM